MILFLRWFFRQNMMDWIFKELITCKGFVRLRQRTIISILSIKSFTWLNGRMRQPFPFIYGWCYTCSHIVSPRAWYFIAFILTSISKINLLTNVLYLLLLFRPRHRYIVMVGRWRVWFFLTFIDEIEISFLGSTLRLKIWFFEPNRLNVCCIYIRKLVLAGPGEQLSLMDWSR